MAQTSDLTGTIVQTVAGHENVLPEDLPPLEEKIPPEQFDMLTAPGSHLSESIEFEYLWYRVTVHPNGEVVVTA